MSTCRLMGGKTHRLFLTLVAVVLTCGLIMPRSAHAAGTFVVDDQAELLTASETSALKESVAGLSAYADAAFVTVSNNSTTTERFSHDYVNKNFGAGPAVIFVIDMDNREIYVYSNKAGLETITQADARAITDNVYQLASRGDYYGCAKEAFAQIQAKYEGGVIARPVKHITNALIAIVVGTLANFLVALSSRAGTTRSKRKRAALARTAAFPSLMVGSPRITRTVTHHYHASGGGGGGGGGFGGGGGGGFSGGGGGGGGHKF